MSGHRELAYLRGQVEELAAENLRLTRRAQATGAQLTVSRRGLALLDGLGGSLGGSTELEPALAAVLPAVAAGLQAQRTVAMRLVGRHFVPFAWNGYDGARAAELARSLVRLDDLVAGGSLVVTRDTPLQGFDEARALLGVPAFVAVTVAGGSHALVVGRLDERAGFFPRFTPDDAHALGAVASVVAGTVANARTAALNEMRRFLPPAVVAEVTSGRMTAHAAHSHREITLLAADLVGSTRLVERLAPDALSALIDSYLREMTSTAHAHSGTIGSVAGDGVLVLFGAPGLMPASEQVRCALEAAFAMRERVAATGAELLGEPLEIRVGINRGRCAIGGFGSDSMRTYTAIGRPVHLAARLESAAEPGEILIGPAVLEHAAGVQVRPRGELTLKGFDAPVSVHAARAGRGS